MKIYKYLNQEDTIRTINNCSAKLNEPANYNDPFDSLFYVSQEELKSAYKIFINYYLFKNFYDELILQKKKPVRMKGLAKIFKKDLLMTASALKRTNWYEAQLYIVPFVSFAPKYLKKREKSLQKQFDSFVQEKINEIRRSILVSCFSEECNSILMWSHYAEKHKGACIEFEVESDDFHKVFYDKKLPLLKLSDLLSIYFAHDFLGKNIDFQKTEYRFAIDPLLTKSEDWIYEQEVRCAFSKKSRNDLIYKDTKGNILLKMPKIQRIIFGCKADKGFIDKVTKISGDIPISFMKMSCDDYGVEIIGE